MASSNSAYPLLLARVPLFADLSDETLRRLGRGALLVEHGRGERLFEAGEIPDYLHLLIDGSVQLTGAIDDREAVVELLRPVDAFIMAAVLTSKPYLMSAKVVDPARLLLIPAALLREQVSTDPRLALTMLGSMANQYRQMVRQVKDLRLRTAAQRLGIYLLRLHEADGDDQTLLLPFDKKLVAARLDMTPESLSRALSVLREHGVEVDFSVVHIAAIERLRKFCRLDEVLDRLDQELGGLAAQ